jgi:hypothetical protein
MTASPQAPVTTPSEADSPWLEPPGAGRALGIGVTIGVIASFVASAGLLLASGQSVGAAIGLGAFVAIWGGLGFGGMVGGVIWASRLESEAAHDAIARSETGPPADQAVDQTVHAA